MREMWDARYGTEKYAYGEAPNDYFRAQLKNRKTGSVLFPAEGEGRNAVHAASLGWEVSAFDYSLEGAKKAHRLARKQNVTLDYKVGDLEQHIYTKESFDSLVLIYAHFPPHQRREYHRRLSSYLKPGGTLILEGFSKNNLALSKTQKASNGPKNLKMLFSREELITDFQGYDIIEIKERIITLNEGPYHQGEASVVRLLAIKH